jgi:hypothetical protein
VNLSVLVGFEASEQMDVAGNGKGRDLWEKGSGGLVVRASSGSFDCVWRKERAKLRSG